MAWGIGGWLLTAFLQKVGSEAAQSLREGVAREIKTTFASRYTKEVSLADALQLREIAVYGKQATGERPTGLGRPALGSALVRRGSYVLQPRHDDRARREGRLPTVHEASRCVPTLRRKQVHPSLRSS
jgi:hypothetical protein